MARRYGRSGRLVPDHVIRQRMDENDRRHEQDLRDRIAAFHRRTQGPYPWSPIEEPVMTPIVDVSRVQILVVDISRQPKPSGGDQ